MARLPIRGSCLCGAVRFELTAPPLFMACCHCSRCRKAGGGMAATVAVRSEDFRWVAGREHVVRYQPEPPWKLIRSFCGLCGTSLGEPDTNAEGGGFPIAASALDDDPGLRVVLHECVADKPAWLDLCDDAHQFPGSAHEHGEPSSE
jgi:hypothetical protein